MSTPQLDDNSPYATLPAYDVNGYPRITVKDHPIADGRGRVRLHRAVKYDEIGEGPHDCHWCGHGGLRWDAGQYSVDYLVVDHLNGDGYDNRLANLAAAHKWCNDNRGVVERLGIPWARVAEKAPADRLNLRTYGGEPNDAARALAAPPAALTTEIVPLADVPPEPEPTAPPETPGHRMYVWDDYVDKEEWEKGNIVLLGPPEWLSAKHPRLRRVPFGRFGHG